MLLLPPANCGPGISTSGDAHFDLRSPMPFVAEIDEQQDVEGIGDRREERARCSSLRRAIATVHSEVPLSAIEEHLQSHLQSLCAHPCAASDQTAPNAHHHHLPSRSLMRQVEAIAGNSASTIEQTSSARSVAYAPSRPLRASAARLRRAMAISRASLVDVPPAPRSAPRRFASAWGLKWRSKVGRRFAHASKSQLCAPPPNACARRRTLASRPFGSSSPGSGLPDFRDARRPIRRARPIDVAPVGSSAPLLRTACYRVPAAATPTSASSCCRRVRPREIHDAPRPVLCSMQRGEAIRRASTRLIAASS